MYGKDMPDGRVIQVLDQAIILMCFHETVLLRTCLSTLTNRLTQLTYYQIGNQGIRTARNIIQLPQLSIEFLTHQMSFFYLGLCFL